SLLRSLFLYCYAPPPHLPSFPTRRSSDLCSARGAHVLLGEGGDLRAHALAVADVDLVRVPLHPQGVNRGFGCRERCRRRLHDRRSEEHTSELQSRFDLVCRLLLEKKKKKV